MSIPDPDSMVPGARNQVISIRLKVLNTADFVFMTLKSFVAFKFLVFIDFPEFDGHVTGTTR